MYIIYFLYIKNYICKYIKDNRKDLCIPNFCGKCSGHLIDIACTNYDYYDIYHNIVNYV